MPIIEVKVNGKTICRAGGVKSPQVGVYVGNTPETDRIMVTTNGYRDTGQYTTEHREWPEIDLTSGDEVSIIVSESGNASEPIKCSTFDNQTHNENIEKMIVDMIAEQRISGEGPGPVLSKEQASKAPYYCSFCARHSSEAEKLIAGPHVNICNECVAICAGLIEGKDNENE